MRIDQAMAWPHPLGEARRRTSEVQQELEVASAELGLAHEALQKNIAPGQRHGDVDWAIDRNAAVEQKVQECAEELESVTELLREEEAERARLEAELASKRKD